MAFVDYERKGNIAIITLNRPDRLNALGRDIIAGIADACQRFENDSQARVAIITGTGRAFSAGADIKEMGTEKQGEPGAFSAHDNIRKVAKPFVAAVNGFALGAGLGVVLATDLRVAAESATFGFPEVQLAIPAGPQLFLAQGLPLSAAMELCIIGDRVSAKRAYDMGLVNKVVPDVELMSAAMTYAERMTGLSPRAVGLIRQSASKAYEASRQIFSNQQSMEESRKITAEDNKEAVKAFIEKRKPVFKD